MLSSLYLTTSTIVLHTAATENEAAIMIGILTSEGIPTMKDRLEAGLYLTACMGFTAFGVNVIIRKRDLEAARELLKSMEEDAQL